MMEVYLDKEESERVHNLLITKFWPTEYPELQGIIERAQSTWGMPNHAAQKVYAKMEELMAAWGLRLAQPPETHEGFIFQDEATYAQFLLQWS